MGLSLKGKSIYFQNLPVNFDGLYDKHREDRGTHNKRISDIFTRGKNPFIVVFDALMENEAGRVLVINKKKISWVVPED